ncbi:MAG: hypothetical protein BRC57_02975 [Cyanobacteria bacterium QS_8_48_54]|nr:MAG: hypothetical protein BRC57_02975 [Cyanobacteria bacterium QS_8_48_54]
MQETETNTTRVSWEELEGMEGETDWERLRNMTEEEIEQNARNDPDAQPTDEEFWIRSQSFLKEGDLDP